MKNIVILESRINSYRLIFVVFAASMRLCMGSRRGFICRMKVGNLSPDSMATGHLNRLKQRNSLGPSRDTHNYAVVHCTGYIKNWPPTGQFDNHALSGTCHTLIFAFGDSFKEGKHKQVELYFYQNIPALQHNMSILSVENNIKYQVQLQVTLSIEVSLSCRP